MKQQVIGLALALSLASVYPATNLVAGDVAGVVPRVEVVRVSNAEVVDVKVALEVKGVEVPAGVPAVADGVVTRVEVVTMSRPRIAS